MAFHWLSTAQVYLWPANRGRYNIYIMNIFRTALRQAYKNVGKYAVSVLVDTSSLFCNGIDKISNYTGTSKHWSRCCPFEFSASMWFHHRLSRWCLNIDSVVMRLVAARTEWQIARSSLSWCQAPNPNLCLAYPDSATEQGRSSTGVFNIVLMLHHNRRCCVFQTLPTTGWNLNYFYPDIR